MTKLTSSALISTVILASHHVDAFTISTPSTRVNFVPKQRMSRMSRLNLTPDEAKYEDNEIEKLRSMAAKLRSDAAALEAEKAAQMAAVAEKAFRQFDTNQDGEISVAELKEGLEKILKTELSEKRVEELMKEFDASGDGALQLDEFVGVDLFRNKLELLAQEEKRLALEAKEQAKKEEVEAAMALAKVEILNEKEPTNSDKVLSVLPYLFPLMDGLQWGRFLLASEGAESNPLVVGLALLYALYRAIPFSGFIAFSVLYFLGGNPSLNRLVRYNMQQAIFVDVALFFPGLIGGVVGLTGLQLPAIASQLGNDAIFVTLLATIGYCTVSSLLGITPNKIPIISPAVEDRMPNIDSFDLDTEGNIVFKPREEEEGKENQKDDKDKK
jgi:hypothetical protein